MAAEDAAGSTYDPSYVLKEGVISKLTTAFPVFGAKVKWDKRFVVLTPTSLLYFKGTARPATGAKARGDLYLGDGAHVESEVEGAQVPLEELTTAFAVVLPGGKAGEPEKQTVFRCDTDDEFRDWITAVDQQCSLTQYAEEHKLAMNMDGNFLNAAREVVTTRAEVLERAYAAIAGEMAVEEGGGESADANAGPSGEPAWNEEALMAAAGDVVDAALPPPSPPPNAPSPPPPPPPPLPVAAGLSAPPIMATPEEAMVTAVAPVQPASPTPLPSGDALITALGPVPVPRSPDVAAAEARVAATAAASATVPVNYSVGSQSAPTSLPVPALQAATAWADTSASGALPRPTPTPVHTAGTGAAGAPYRTTPRGLTAVEGGVPGGGHRTQISNAIASPHGPDIPKAKFRAWAERDGVPPAPAARSSTAMVEGKRADGDGDAASVGGGSVAGVPSTINPLPAPTTPASATTTTPGGRALQPRVLQDKGGIGSTRDVMGGAAAPATRPSISSTAASLRPPHVALNTEGAIDAAAAAAARASQEVAALLSAKPLNIEELPLRTTVDGHLLTYPPAVVEAHTRSRSGSQDNGLAALDAIDLDARSVTGGGGGGMMGRGVGGGSRPASRPRSRAGSAIAPAASGPPDTITVMLGPPSRAIPLREVRRQFDAMTAFTNGILPLTKLGDLITALGMRVDAAYISNPATNPDPSGKGGIDRHDFLTWWKGYAMAQARAYEVEAQRISAAAASHVAEMRRATTRGRGAGDRATVDTWDTEADTATVSTTTQVAVLQAQAAARAVAHGGDGGADAAMDELESGLESAMANTMKMMAELTASLSHPPPATTATATGTDVVGTSTNVQPPATPSSASAPLSSHDWLSKYSKRGTGPGLLDTDLTAATFGASGIHNLSSTVMLEGTPRSALVTPQHATPAPPAVAARSGGGFTSPILLSTTAGIEREPAPVMGAGGLLARRSGPTPAAIPPAANPLASSILASLGSPTSSPILTTALVPTATLANVAAWEGGGTSGMNLAVGLTLSHAIEEGTGRGAGAYDAEYFLPMPAVVPAGITAGRGVAGAMPVQGAAPPHLGLGIAHRMDVPLLTAEAARFPALTVTEQEGKAAGSSGEGPPSRSGSPLSAALAAASAAAVEVADLQTAVTVVGSADVEEGEWNERYQRLLERPEWRFGAAVTKAAAVSTFLGRFDSLASEAASIIVDEMGLPANMKTLPSIDVGAGGGSGEEGIYFYKGIFLRVAEVGASRPGDDAAVDSTAFTTITSSPEAVQRKVAGHELRGLRCVQDASTCMYREWCASVGTPEARKAAGVRRPPPLCALLTALVDVGGYRLYAMAVPPMDDARTLVYGKLDDAAPFVQRSPILSSMLRRVAKHLNLKPHAVEALSYSTAASGEEDGASGAVRTLIIPLSVDTQGHLCPDKRFYLMNVGRLHPADLPETSISVDSVTCMLRPELVRGLDKPLSCDAFRSGTMGNPSSALVVAGSASAAITIGSPPDAPSNDMEAAKASQHLLSVVIPRWVAEVECLRPGAPIPTDSFTLTVAMHANGINMRYLGRIATLATSQWLRELAEVEMVARIGKHILHRNLRRIGAQVAAGTVAALSAVDGATARTAVLRQHVATRSRESMATVTDLFNLFLGASDDAVSFWREIVAPAVYHKFAYRLRPGTTGGVVGPEAASIAGVPGARTTHMLTGHKAPTAAWTTPYAGLHKPALFHALQHHCCVTLVPDVPPLPATLPALARTAVGVSGEGIAVALSAATKGLSATSVGVYAHNDAGVLTPQAAGIYATIPALAPITHGNVAHGTSPTIGLHVTGTGVTLQGMVAAPMSVYDFSQLEPIHPSLLQAMTPAVAALRPGMGVAPLETSVLAQEGEAHMAAGQWRAALEAFNLRLAMLQGLATGGMLTTAAASPGHATSSGSGGLSSWDGAALAPADRMEVARAMLDVARVHLVLRHLEDVVSVTSRVLRMVSGRHAVAAQALLLRAQAIVLSGDEDGGLAVYAQALEAAQWHLGKHFPLSLNIAIGMAGTLAVVGRCAAGATLLEGATEWAQRMLGQRHAMLPAMHAAAGHMYRVAAAAGTRAAAAFAGVDVAPSLSSAPAISSEGLSTLARIHAVAYLARAVDSYERGLVLLEASMDGPYGTGVTATATARHHPDSAASLLGAGRVLKEQIADVTAALADAVAAQGKLTAAVATAKKAFELRRSAVAPGTHHSAGLLQSLQQVAALCDRLDKPLDAIRHLEPLVSALKGVRSEAALQALQRGTRHIVRLTFRTMPTNHRALLQQVVTCHGDAAPPAVAFVVRSLFDAPKPSEVVRSIATRVLASISAGTLSMDATGRFVAVAGLTPPSEPSLPDQLAAVVSLLAVPHRAGADVTSDAGATAASLVGSESAASSALRPPTESAASLHQVALSITRLLSGVAGGGTGVLMHMGLPAPGTGITDGGSDEGAIAAAITSIITV